jgi:hypothetical protein
MANQHDFVKTALRLPKGLHADIQAAAATSGRSMNAEIIDRLQSGSSDATAALLRRLEGSERALLESQRKQIDVLWSVLDRASTVLDQCDELALHAHDDRKASEFRQSLQLVREFIGTIRAHR